MGDLPLATACSVLVLADQFFSEDPKTSDSACLACTITLDSILKGRYPKFYEPPEEVPGKIGTPRIICQVLSPVLERALPSSHALRKTCTFFHSSAVETGLFTMASAEASVYNAILML